MPNHGDRLGPWNRTRSHPARVRALLQSGFVENIRAGRKRARLVDRKGDRRATRRDDFGDQPPWADGVRDHVAAVLALFLRLVILTEHSFVRRTHRRKRTEFPSEAEHMLSKVRAVLDIADVLRDLHVLVVGGFGPKSHP